MTSKKFQIHNYSGNRCLRPWFTLGIACGRQWSDLAVDLCARRLNGVPVAMGLDYENHVWFNDSTTALLLISVVHVWPMMPLTIVIVLAAMQSIPAELYEAVCKDGATRFEMFRTITLPLTRGAIAVAMTNATVSAFNLFDEAIVLARNSLETRPIPIQIYLEAFKKFRFSCGMAPLPCGDIGVAARFVGLCSACLPQHEPGLMREPLHVRLFIWIGVALLLLWSPAPIYWTLASSVTPWRISTFVLFSFSRRIRLLTIFSGFWALAREWWEAWMRQDSSGLPFSKVSVPPGWRQFCACCSCSLAPTPSVLRTQSAGVPKIRRYFNTASATSL